MIIITAHYSTPVHVPLIVEYDTGAQSGANSYPSGGRIDADIDAFIAGGGVIADYDEHHGKTDEVLREQRYNLNASLADEEIELAEHTPQQGVTLDDRGAIKENLHRNNRAKRNASMTDQDDAMADYVDSVYDALDIADDIVENLDRAGLEAWDGSSINWPIWSPPV